MLSRSNDQGAATTQLWAPHRGTGAANRAAASYDSQSNVRKCSSYFVARDRSHRGGETPCGIGMRLRGSSHSHQPSHRHLCASSASAEHGGSRRAAGTGWQLEPPRDVARAQTRAELATGQKGLAARGHLRRQRGGVRLSHRRRAGIRWPWRSKRTSHWRVGNVRSNFSVEGDSPGSNHPIAREAGQVRNVSLGRRDLLTTVRWCGGDPVLAQCATFRALRRLLVRATVLLDDAKLHGYEKAYALMIHCFKVAESAATDPTHSLEWMWPILEVPIPESIP